MKKYSLRAVLLSFAPPLLLVLGTTPLWFKFAFGFMETLLTIFAVIFSQATPFILGWQMAKKLTLPKTFLKRFLPLFVPVLLLLAVVCILILGLEISFRGFSGLGVSILLLCALASYPAYWVGFLIKSERKEPSINRLQAIGFLAGLLVFLAGLNVLAQHYVAVKYPLGDVDTSGEAYPYRIGHGVDIYTYMPCYYGTYNEDLARLDAPSSLAIYKNPPKLDGAIALLPLYAAAVQSVYKLSDDEEYYDLAACTNTPVAYPRLIDGEVDIFFGLPPSKEQSEYAREKGVTLTLTPLAKEAFVFLTHKDNPVQNLTSRQIKDIYSRKITNWRELGGPDEEILAFQRAENSGSQTTMIKFMKDEKLTTPRQAEMYEGMGDLIRGVADYDNGPASIGYSFRWYASVQYSSPDVKFLAVDGVAPTEENIRSGRYPLTVEMYAVTARPLSPESRAFLDWLKGPEGQELIRRVGYVPLNPPAKNPPSVSEK